MRKYFENRKTRRKRRTYRLFMFLLIFAAIIILLLALVIVSRVGFKNFFYPFLQAHRYKRRDEIIESKLVRPRTNYSDVLVGFLFLLTQDAREIDRFMIVKLPQRAREFSDYKNISGIFFESHLWINLFNAQTKSAQIISLFDVASHLNRKPFGFAIEQMVYNTGVLPNFVIFAKGEEVLASNTNLFFAENVLRSASALNFKKYEPLKDDFIILEDGTKAYRLVYATFKAEFNEFSKIDALSLEHAFVEIYNASHINRYATFWARVLEQSGVEVSRVGTYSGEEFNKETDCTVIIFVTSNRAEKTVKYLEELFNLPPSCKRYGRPKSLLTTGDVVIILNKLI